MKIIRALGLLIPSLLIIVSGCQATRARPDLGAAQSDLGVSSRDSSAAVGVVQPPDSDALAATSPPPPPEQFVPAPRLADIYFDYDAYAIRAEDTRVLDENAEWLRANPNTLVLIEGHTDERGTSEYNLGLGDRRAAAAMSYLLTRGIPARRMVAISYGKERPFCTEQSEGCWARNRRAHFLIKPL
jgi:peptidoglycan-associated lipoprotein